MPITLWQGTAILIGFIYNEKGDRLGSKSSQKDVFILGYPNMKKDFKYFEDEGEKYLMNLIPKLTKEQKNTMLSVIESIAKN